MKKQKMQKPNAPSVPFWRLTQDSSRRIVFFFFVFFGFPRVFGQLGLGTAKTSRKTK